MIEYHLKRCDFDLDTENDILSLNTHLIILAAEDDESGKFSGFFNILNIFLNFFKLIGKPLIIIFRDYQQKERANRLVLYCLKSGTIMVMMAFQFIPVLD